MDKNLMSTARKEWEQFTSTLKEDEKAELSQFEQPIESWELIHYANAKDSIRFDQTYDRLTKKFRYDEDIIPIVYEYFIERDLQELAYEYITGARDYLELVGATIPPHLLVLMDNSQSRKLLAKLKLTFGQLHTLQPRNLPYATPDMLNDKYLLSEFILEEFVRGGKMLLDKIRSIQAIKDENKYSDLFMAALRLRFQIWGWGLTDQSPRGVSGTGINPGETDFTIDKGNVVFALVEAFTLVSGNASKVKTHIEKIFGYVNYLERYYMVIYYLGPPANFGKTWEAYKSDVAACVFPPAFTYGITDGFVDLEDKFDNVISFKIAKTQHNSKTEIFHLMIDLSEKR